MPKRIPVKVAREVAKETGCRQVILMAWDGERTHCVTYGKSVEDCDQAAIGGNRIKKALGWPESLQGEPSRVKKLKAEVAELKKVLKLAARWGVRSAGFCSEVSGQIRRWVDGDMKGEAPKEPEHIRGPYE